MTVLTTHLRKDDDYAANLAAYQDHLETLQIVLACYESAETGNSVKLSTPAETVNQP